MSDDTPHPPDNTHNQSSVSPSNSAAEPDRGTRQLDTIEAIAEVEAAEVAEDVAEDVAEVTVKRRIRPLEGLMLTMLAVSLLILAFTLARLFNVRNTLRSVIGQLAESVQAAKRDQVRYDLPIDQQIPIDLDVPIKRSLIVPIRTEVRIKQDIVLPVETGFGNLNIPIPVDANIPISTTVPIDFDQTVNISTSVPLKLNVPIQIDLGSPQVSGYLDRLHQALLKLRDEL